MRGEDEFESDFAFELRSHGNNLPWLVVVETIY